MEKNKWKFPDRTALIEDKWEYLGNAWYLSQNISEYLTLIEMDYLELMKLVALKLTAEFQGVAPKD